MILPKDNVFSTKGDSICLRSNCEEGVPKTCSSLVKKAFMFDDILARNWVQQLKYHRFDVCIWCMWCIANSANTPTAYLRNSESQFWQRFIHHDIPDLVLLLTRQNYFGLSSIFNERVSAISHSKCTVHHSGAMYDIALSLLKINLTFSFLL